MNRRSACVAMLLYFLASGPANSQGEVKKVSKGDALTAVTYKTQPQYPPIARQLRVEGTVALEATISEEGKVEKVDIVSGSPMLTRTAADALKAWRFKPFLEDGKPVKVQAPVSFEFKLGN